VCTGGSFGSSTLRQEIGLGRSREIKRVEIYWPVSGSTQVIKDLYINQFYRIREGERSAEKMDLQSFKWPAGSGA
jgi:hypothetical protein